MHDILWTLVGLPLGIWAYLLIFHGKFWQETPAHLARRPIADWPEVVAIVPARNESALVGRAIESILAQDYPGRLSVILVDDDSTDGTTEAAREAADRAGRGAALAIERSPRLPSGWTGKLWAVQHGVQKAVGEKSHPKYLWLTDADIFHEKEVLSGLVSLAEEKGLVLASLMARLRMESLAERALAPAYVYFFQLLYPFAWVNRARHRTAGAAGGCMLVRASALNAAGGIEAIRAQLIDDCALARVLKKQGAIWLGLADKSHSLRSYPDWASIWNLVARSAFTQLRRSNLLLLACLFGMAAAFLAPPALTISADPVVRAFGLTSWCAMTLSFVPTLRYYNASVLWGPALPIIALFYMAATFDSARRHWMGRGGEWKGRMQARETA
jgi:hopene-associated glycosyltransferase HpnB